MLTEQARQIDQPLLDGLAHKGFRLDFGDDGTGWQFKYLTRGGGYYFNVGCSDLIVEGKVGWVPSSRRRSRCSPARWTRSARFWTRWWNVRCGT
jgi:hypothetical protein